MSLYPRVSLIFNDCKIYAIYKGNILQDIGYTVNSFQSRFKQHLSKYRHSKIGMLMKVEGIHNFSVELVEHLNCDDYNQIAYREQYWIQLLNPPLHVRRPPMWTFLPSLPKSFPLDIDEIPPPLPTTPIPTL